MSLKEKLVEFLMNDPKTLKEMYDEFDEYEPHSVRARIYEGIDKRFKRIGKGVYLSIKDGAKALIIEGDSWEVIKELDDNSIDAIITDSGYTCLNHHLAKGTTRKQSNQWSFETKDMDEIFYKELHRVLKQGGHFFSFAAPDAADTLDYNDKQIAIARKAGFEFNKRFIWNKVLMGMGYNGRNTYEQIFFFSKGKRGKPRNMAVRDLLTHKSLRGNKLHEAEKPVSLIKELVLFSTDKGDVVLDPFGGSMSTAKACTELGRHSISFEINAEAIQKGVKVE